MESAGDEGGAAGPDPPTAVAQTETRQVDVHLPVADLASGACVQLQACKSAKSSKVLHAAPGPRPPHAVPPNDQC